MLHAAHASALWFAAAITLCPLPLAAAAFPVKPVRLIVPFPPGAFNDQLARTLSQKLGERWKQPVVVDNRPGASTVIGTDLAARAPADGHTLLIVSFAFAVNPSLHRSLPFDTGQDFTPVVLAAGTPNILVVHPGLPATSVKDLVQLARERPGRLDYATAGNGTSNHLCTELFKSLAGVDLVHVPYKGSAPAVTDLLGGQVQVMFDNAPNVLPHVRAGKLRALAVTTAKRSAAAPDYPTIAEAGVPGYEHASWVGILAPARTPSAVVAKLNSEIDRIVHLPEVKEFFLRDGLEPDGGPTKEFATNIRNEVAKWMKVVKAAGIKPQ
jgi:tripartite-type tricarboxylate transporter receptor subunit TctC